MITKSKLANQPQNKLTKKFRPIDTKAGGFYDNPQHISKGKKKRNKKFKTVLLLFSLLLLVSGATFGAIWGISLLTKQKNEENVEINEPTDEPDEPEQPANPEDEQDDELASIQPITNAPSSNPTIALGRLMLINPNFTVDEGFISSRKTELISLQDTYSIKEFKASNGDNLLDKEAAEWLNKMLTDYTVANPGHEMQTRSCFREVGTNCGRMCAATGTSDHHTGLTCDLIDPVYGTDLNTDAYNSHFEWQWLRENSYKYGFIDRFPEAWAGGPMSEPAVVNEDGTTGLFETWHYRYVGVYAATQIATGVYNNGQYDSLEHYLKMRGLVPNLLNN